MRVIFASLGNYGHMFPMVPLAQAAQAARPRVWFATSEQFHPILEKAGLRPVTAGPSVPEAYIEAAGGQAFLEANGGATKASDIPPDVLAALGVKAFSSVLPRSVSADLARVFDSVRPDLVVYETYNPGAAFAAVTAGVPAVCHGIGRVWYDATMDPLFQQELFATATDLGVADKIGQSRTLGNPFIDICPPSVQNEALCRRGRQADTAAACLLRRTGRTARARHPGGRGPTGLPQPRHPRWARRNCCAPWIDGSAALQRADPRRDGPRPYPAAPGQLPDRVVALPWLPQPEALRHATAVVHHGGQDTSLASPAWAAPS